MKFKVLVEKVARVSPKHPGCGCGAGIKTPIGMI